MLISPEKKTRMEDAFFKHLHVTFIHFNLHASHYPFRGSSLPFVLIFRLLSTTVLIRGLLFESFLNIQPHP